MISNDRGGDSGGDGVNRLVCISLCIVRVRDTNQRSSVMRHVIKHVYD